MAAGGNRWVVVVLVLGLAAAAAPASSETIAQSWTERSQVALATFVVGELTIGATAERREVFVTELTNGEEPEHDEAGRFESLVVEHRDAEGRLVARCTDDLDGDGFGFEFDDITGSGSVRSERCDTNLDWTADQAQRRGAAGAGGRIAISAADSGRGGNGGGAILLSSSAAASGTVAGNPVGADELTSAETQTALTHELTHAVQQGASTRSSAVDESCGEALVCWASGEETETTAEFAVDELRFHVLVSDVEGEATRIAQDGSTGTDQYHRTSIRITVTDPRNDEFTCEAELDPDAFGYDPDTGIASVRSSDPCPAEIEWRTQGDDNDQDQSQQGERSAGVGGGYGGLGSVSADADLESGSSKPAEATGQVFGIEVEAGPDFAAVAAVAADALKTNEIL